ncbi:unnamed protein product [Spirodela intermedia]|uniref:Uncharacterized protein n=1 Tax=Spirodela intermedia TaxID=51605 RepID=A0A7I8IF89_SPIIN|nr:unnamed protein product [Spirodela intermedia]CAA6655532.1 unnamed protein product [Spirodela intermedia]
MQKLVKTLLVITVPSDSRKKNDNGKHRKGWEESRIHDTSNTLKVGIWH